MLTNFSITTSTEKLKEKFFLEQTEEFTPNYNIQPTQLSPVITSSAPDSISLFQWGLTEAFTKKKTASQKFLYAPIDDIGRKASLRNSFMMQRCVVLADSFYVWKSISKKDRVPYRFHLPNNEPFAIAGIWNNFSDDEDHDAKTFMLVTKKGEQHNNLLGYDSPCLLNDEVLVEWLNPDMKDDTLLDFVNTQTEPVFLSHPVNPRLADPSFNSEILWKEVPPANQFGNLTLFN